MRVTKCDICGNICVGHGTLTVDRLPLNGKHIPECVHTVIYQVDICYDCAEAIQKVIDERTGWKNEREWMSTSEQLPLENQVVDTKIDDEKGVRNEQELIYIHNRWLLPDKSMYVYYTPTHWRYTTKMDGKDGKK